MADVNTSGVRLSDKQRVIKRRRLEVEHHQNVTGVMRLEVEILELEDSIDSKRSQIDGLNKRNEQLKSELSKSEQPNPLPTAKTPVKESE